MGTIEIVNKKNHKECEYDFYIGRPSPLGNGWSHYKLPHTIYVPTREEAITKYSNWLHANLENTTIRDKITQLLKLYKEGKTIHLVCWCTPQKCHGDVIKQVIETLAAEDT
jgi:hypothetical protein